MRLTAPRPAPDDTATAIVDNRTRTVGNFLAGHSVPDSLLSVVSAYFTIYGYGDLRDQLDRIGRMRFLYGDPRGVGAVDPEEAEDKAFRLTDEGNLELTQALRQKPLARACAKWIERKADIRTITQSNFLHGKMYHITKPDGAAPVPGETAALLGSSNFTRRGLGTGSNPNLELNLEVRSAADRAPLLDWFDRLWHDEELTHDAKKDVLDALERLGRDYSPEFVYYKTLYHVLGDRLAQQEESEKLAGGVHLFDSQIWNHLYDFQRHGVISAINRLLLHNGCIVADSVGLGKTFTALGVIKYFESRNERVLVLCPSRLKPNWLRYLAYTGQRTNPFIADRFGYTVLAHTDLS
ncbi:MAG: ATP-dependent helicase, partial [Gemmatimonadetes bacterium]|nr:ATP-dependent helicase [Gemmatimonadota bacterium]